MDFLNKAIAQLSELFRSMTPGARITAGLAAGRCGRQRWLSVSAQRERARTRICLAASRFPSGQLDRIEAAIAKAGLSDFQREGFRIRVPSGQQAKYLAAVADAGALPPNFNTILENALDKGGPWESREATRERLKIARQQTLSEIVRAMPWVENAIVLYDEHESRGRPRVRNDKANHRVGQREADRGRNAHTAAGEEYSKARRTFGEHETERRGHHQLGRRRTGWHRRWNHVRYYRRRVLENESHVRIAEARQHSGSAPRYSGRERGSERRLRRHGRRDHAHGEARSEDGEPRTESRRPKTSRRQTPERPAASRARLPRTKSARCDASSCCSSRISKHNESTRTDNVVGIEDSRIVKKGYTPKEVWATVSIPSSYIKSLWAARNPTATAPPKPDDLRLCAERSACRRLRILSTTLLILQANKGENNYKHVRVVVLDSLPVPTIEAPSMASKAMAWTGRYWNTLAMLGVAMFSLLVLRSVVNGKPSEPASSAAASAHR